MNRLGRRLDWCRALRKFPKRTTSSKLVFEATNIVVQSTIISLTIYAIDLVRI